MRTVWDAREIVLEDKAPFETVSENLKVKKVELGGKSYVVCLNEEEAKRAKAVREEVIAELREMIAPGPKRLVGHSPYRKYLHLNKDAVSVNEQKIIDKKSTTANRSCSPTPTSRPRRPPWCTRDCGRWSGRSGRSRAPSRSGRSISPAKIM